MIDNVNRVVFDAIHDSRAILRKIVNSTADYVDIDEKYHCVHAGARTLLASCDLMLDALQGGKVSESELESWLGDVEDLGNDWATLPRYFEEDDY